MQLQFVRLQSLASREFVKERFAWRHHYWYLTNEGINYLREYLHLPAEIVPATVKSKPREPRPAFAGDRLTRGLYSALVHIFFTFAIRYEVRSLSCLMCEVATSICKNSVEMR